MMVHPPMPSPPATDASLSGLCPSLLRYLNGFWGPFHKLLLHKCVCVGSPQRVWFSAWVPQSRSQRSRVIALPPPPTSCTGPVHRRSQFEIGKPEAPVGAEMKLAGRWVARARPHPPPRGPPPSHAAAACSMGDRFPPTTQHGTAVTHVGNHGCCLELAKWWLLVSATVPGGADTQHHLHLRA